MMQYLGRSSLRVSSVGLAYRRPAGLYRASVATAKFPNERLASSEEIVDAAIAGGITWFNPNARYGTGASEHALSAILRAREVLPGQVTISTEGMRLGCGVARLERHIEKSLTALSPYPIGVYQVKLLPGECSFSASQVRSLARFWEAGHIGAVGASNLSSHQMERVYRVLADQGMPLASNRVKVSLLQREIEVDGLLSAAERLGVTLIACSPLAGGLLSEEGSEDLHPLAEMRNSRRLVMRMTRRNPGAVEPLMAALREISASHAVSLSQVALAWLLQNYRGAVVVIAGVSKPRHAREAAAAQDLILGGDEVEQLNSLSDGP